MERFDVAIVGGGPAGSTCAWRLTQAGLRVVVIDRATFPRDKVCAGWITPPVIDALELDVDDYRIGRRLQSFTAFRVGVIGDDRDVETRYEGPISFGIRRCEFDHYLLERSGAALRLGMPIASLRRADAAWVVNDAIAAPLLVGAGGHFCPVARALNGPQRMPRLVAAQEAEFPIGSSDAQAMHAASGEPELFFARDLSGYGWCVRKREYVNVGFGHVSDRALPEASAEFAAFLKRRGRIPANLEWRWKGHAYLLADPPHRRATGDGALLIGDAAGLAYAQSGEGIRPAVESALIAAQVIIDAAASYARVDVEPYEQRLRQAFGGSGGLPAVSRLVPVRAGQALGRWLLHQPWFVRRVVLDRWFLHGAPPLRAAGIEPLRSAPAGQV